MMWHIRSQLQRWVSKFYECELDMNLEYQDILEQDYWHMEALFTHITNNTHVFIEIKNKAQFCRERVCNVTKPRHPQKFKLLLGCYIGGRIKCLHTNLKYLWNWWRRCQNFPLVMPINKLLFLLGSVQFDDITTKRVKRLMDKLATVKYL